MTAGFLDGNVFRGLAFRILLFLSLALLPLGLIAVIQTREIARQSDINSELSLLAVTEHASNAERAAIQEGFGVAKALTSIVRLYIDDREECHEFLKEYQVSSNLYSLVGFLPVTGKMECSSSDKTFDFSDYPNFDEMMENPRRRATASRDAPLSSQSVVALSQPLFAGEQFLGYVVLSIPTLAISQTPATEIERAPENVVTFNTHGFLLTADDSVEAAAQELPVNRKLSLLVGSDPTVFADVNANGEDRIYAVVPIVPGVVYAMSIWSDVVPFAQIARTSSLSVFLPVLMWIASLVVAFWALNRLAITHIKKLGRQMRHFAFNRRLPRAGMGMGVPREIVDMEQAFVGMAESIIRDEASLEDNLRQKNILLKEVHHRVKNNLQLISSIMNMQIRQARTEDARAVLKRLQDRILSLATVHKSLYQNDDLQRVDGGALVRDIVKQQLSVGLSAGSGMKITQTYEAISLDPDDAAPLSLTVSEAVTNALKYFGAQEGERPCLDISLKYDGPDSATLTIANTVGPGTPEEGSGLGAQLINAFARQLNGQIEVSQCGVWHRVVLRFPIPQQPKQVYDY